MIKRQLCAERHRQPFALVILVWDRLIVDQFDKSVGNYITDTDHIRLLCHVGPTLFYSSYGYRAVLCHRGSHLSKSLMLACLPDSPQYKCMKEAGPRSLALEYLHS